jgi:alpha-1,2-mannosyltransferase
MSAFLAAMRDGRWLTRERIRLWALAVLAASVLGFAFLLATSDGLNDYQGRPLGTDFSNVYAAGTYVLDGQAAAPFDWPAQHAREQMIFGEKTPFYGWHYPPYFLFIAGLLALMPFTLALAVWQGVTLALYFFTIRTIISASWPGLSRPSTAFLFGRSQGVDARDKPGHDSGVRIVPDNLWILLALAFPAVFVNIGHGHNGFLTAALIGTALLTLDRRPVVSGILFGLMAYKPQFGVLIPLVLAASGRWRVFLAATVTVAVLTLSTVLAFGPDVWRAFVASMPLTRVEVLEQGGTGWHKIQSVFSVVRMWGGGIPLAYTAQATATIAIAAALAWLWRSHAAYPLKAAALIVASILATPYSLDYDFVILAPALAFLAADGLARGFSPWEKTALALLWFMPLIARSIAEQVLVPLGVPLMLLVFVLVLARAAADTGFSTGWHSAAQPIK